MPHAARGAQRKCLPCRLADVYDSQTVNDGHVWPAAELFCIASVQTGKQYLLLAAGSANQPPSTSPTAGGGACLPGSFDARHISMCYRSAQGE